MKAPICVALVAAAAVISACSGAPSPGSGLTTASILDGQGKSPTTSIGITNDNPMARPLYAAFTAARAEKCGFNFDAAGLRSRYLAYETQQGGNGQPIAQIEKTYDSTFQRIRTGLEEDACSDKKSAEIKAALSKQLAGDFTPNFPAPKKEVAQCGGLFAPTCQDNDPNQKFNSKDFWQKIEDDRRGVRSK
jgi:aerobic-type carbon monoxide dehydrogenase small subunit (CoxS/CutS family)